MNDGDGRKDRGFGGDSERRGSLLHVPTSCDPVKTGAFWLLRGRLFHN